MYGYTQETFAEKANFSYKYYQAIEAGRQRDVQLSTVERLAQAYGLEAHELLAPELPRSARQRAKKKRR